MMRGHQCLRKNRKKKKCLRKKQDYAAATCWLFGTNTKHKPNTEHKHPTQTAIHMFGEHAFTCKTPFDLRKRPSPIPNTMLHPDAGRTMPNIKHQRGYVWCLCRTANIWRQHDKHQHKQANKHCCCSSETINPLRRVTVSSRSTPTKKTKCSDKPKLCSKIAKIKKPISPIVPKVTNNRSSTHNKVVMNVLNTSQNAKMLSSAGVTKAKTKKKKIVPYEGKYKCVGLSPKEKMYIIGNCQTRSNRYLQLKNIASDAIKNNKIFVVLGSCSTVRKALVERGWVEKLPPHRMNMNNIRNGRMNKHEIRSEMETLLLSHLVEKYNPSFIWRTKDNQTDKIIDMGADYVPTVNRLQIDPAWTTKQGLCSAMKRNYWFYIEDVAEVYSPRTYNSYDASEVDSFNKDFKITACTSLLKWVLSMVANDRPVFISTGTVSINVILFALNRCKEYLYRKQNRDIDKPVNEVSIGQWNSFIKNYYRIISKADHFKMDKDKQLNLYLSYAKLLLKEIHKYRPQLSCEGCHNIWIVKPAHCCRGRGIKMGSKLGELSEILNKAKAKYVVQKYIEEPLLIYETKFDIRQYYLITNTCPLVIWMYKDCYLKFSSQKYNLKNYHESIHLTNNAVQKKYKNCDNRHGELPLSNMWDLDKYKNYLIKIGKKDVWDNIIYPGMRKSIVSIVLGCQDSLTLCKNRFELYGCDFLLDKDYKPWIIEINSCPDLNHTTPVTAKICPAVIADIIKVVIDYARNPNAETGKFECIYRQPFSMPRFCSMGGELSVRGYSLPASYFYRGEIEPRESLDNLNVGYNLDIAAVMKMMKTIYDEDTKLEPDKDYVSEKSYMQAQLEKRLPKECILSSTSPSGIADRLTDIIDKVVSDMNITTKSEVVNSETAKSVKNDDSNSTEPKSYEEDSDLNTDITDGSSRDNGWVDLKPLEHALHELSPSTAQVNPHFQEELKQISTIINRKSVSEDAISRAVSNLLSFLKRKEEECDIRLKKVKAR